MMVTVPFLLTGTWTQRRNADFIPWFIYATTVQLADAVARWEGGTQERVLALREMAEGFLVTAQGGYLALPEEGY